VSVPSTSRVLIADDTPGVRALVRALLETSGRFEVLAEAHNGAEAVELAARHRPDLVLLDLAMPMIDGLQALPAIVTSSPASRVVALSGFEARHMAASAIEQGAVAYLEKDLLPDRLVMELLRVLDDLEPAHSRSLPQTGAIAGTGKGIDEGTLNPRYLFDTFVPGASNRFAHAAALSVAETPGKSYNPLFIYGATGLGKTHLLHAIGHYTRQNYADRDVRYVSTETFTNEFIDGIRTGTATTLKQRYRECDVLLVDDVHFLEGKERTQEEFFHTFNALHGSGRQIVLTSDRPPKSIPTLEDRLRSRFEWGLITDVQRPDVETRLAILRHKADVERSTVPDEVLEFIATHITDNIRELEGALLRAIAYASVNRVPLTPDSAERVLSDLLSTEGPRPITSRMILEATAETFGYTVEELYGTSRWRPLVTARQIGMYVHRELTDLSYPAIAREFGGRDHTTVMHAVARISELMKVRPLIYDQVTQLINRIKTGR
jgi:chromosomal replication initiator protein